MSEKSCISCSRISHSEICSVCNKPTSTNWSGFLLVIDPDNSDIAKGLNITLAGEYSLRVR
ncbi:MAG: DNA-directed RNA polymerase subunit E'' [Methanobrevibacter sp.]|jgi:DNA-directed RNA polymerase subunit E"|nr:DNA-directed RNA polymerase subunit E'' [Candidatus Methanovirga basalitermitum]